MSELRWSYEELCNFIPIITRASSTPMLAGDLNPMISKFLYTIPDCYIYAIGGHSIILWISGRVMAKVSLRAGCPNLCLEQRIFELLDTTPSPYVVATFLSRPDVIFMESLQNGTLQERLTIGKRPESILPWIFRITSAAACLEQHGYVHGDLNPRNIVFNDQDQPVLTDFDHALLIGQPLDVGDEPYVRCFREAVGGQYGVAGALTEQFALGSIFYFILTGTELYDDIPPHERVTRLMDGDFPDLAVSGRIGEIIRECWQGRYRTLAELLQRISNTMAFDESYRSKRSECEDYYRDVLG